MLGAAEHLSHLPSPTAHTGPKVYVKIGQEYMETHRSVHQ